MNRHRFHALIPTGLLALAIGSVIAGCAAERTADDPERADDFIGHYRPEMIDMSDVMQAKMLHTQAIVEGLARGDLRQVAVNAEMLHELSERGTWMVHDTVTYIAMSDEFRAIVSRMSDHANAKDMDAVIEDYTDLTRSCIACHTYLRKQRLEKEMPGAVSLLSRLD